MSFIPAPIFILCAPRSLDAYIASRLALAFKDAYLVPELNLFNFCSLGLFVEHCQDLQSSKLHGLRRLIAEIYTGEQTKDSIDTANRWINQRIEMTSAAIYLEIGNKLSPFFFIEKNCSYGASSNSLRRIIEAFPNPFFIHLIRNPIFTCYSVLNQSYGQLLLASMRSYDYNQNKPILDPQVMWYNVNKTVADFLSTYDQTRQLTIKAEEFYASEISVLEKISYNFGLPLIPDLEVPPVVRYPFGAIGPMGGELGNDEDFLRNPTKHYDESICLSDSLTQPLPWRPDSQPLFPHIQDLAREFHYP